MTKNKNANICILISTFNGVPFIAEQLISLYNQTVSDIKIYIRDDGSSDNTNNIVGEYVKLYPSKIFLVNDKLGNLGASRSFMQLLKVVKNFDYYMFCDQDDVWLPEKIEESLEKMKVLEANYNADTPLMVFTDLSVVDSKKNIIANSFWKQQKFNIQIALNWKKLLAQNVVTGCTMIFNHKSRELALPFLLPEMMHDQWIAVNVAKFGKLSFIPQSTILYRQHDGNVFGGKRISVNYFFSKVTDTKKIFRFFLNAAKHFGGVSVSELFLLKLQINSKRIFL